MSLYCPFCGNRIFNGMGTPYRLACDDCCVDIEIDRVGRRTVNVTVTRKEQESA